MVRQMAESTLAEMHCFEALLVNAASYVLFTGTTQNIRLDRLRILKIM